MTRSVDSDFLRMTKRLRDSGTKGLRKTEKKSDLKTVGSDSVCVC